MQADKSRTAEVISNLLSNAIKFTPKGTITISLEKDKTNKKNDKNWMIVSVKDTGQGIDVSMLKVIKKKLSDST
ncbi:MAG: ATP-binding protein [Candidatus Nitrosopolaris sp.]